MSELLLSSGKVLHWKEYGNKQGLPLIYCHGVPGSSVEPGIADDIALQKGIRVIAADLPGFGHSETIENFQLSDFPVVIEQLADHLGLDHFSMLGFSAGGPFALACSHTLSHRINHLTLVSSLAPFESSVMQQYVNADFKPLYDLTLSDYNAATQQIASLSTSAEALQIVMEAPLLSSDKAVFQRSEFRSAHLNNMALSILQGAVGIVDALRAVRSNWKFQLSEIKTRVDIWQGGEDVITHREVGKYLNQNLPHSEMHLLEREGHYLQFNHWMDILSSVKKSLVV